MSSIAATLQRWRSRSVERKALHWVSWLFDRRTLSSFYFVTIPEGRRLGGHPNIVVLQAADKENGNKASRLSHRFRLLAGNGGVAL
jgi:hypothetical protein